MGFEIQHEQFKGPFELLLNLIEERKLLINEVSLSKVTDDFITYLQQQEKFPMGESAHFILVAATLILIKSKSLLPTLELTSEEQKRHKTLKPDYKFIKESESRSDYSRKIWQKYGFCSTKQDFMETVFLQERLRKRA